MRATFVEATDFTEVVTEILPDREYAKLQQLLMENPEAGDVMAGCGGVRKVRTADTSRGKGKRGGARVIYFYIPEAKRFYMLDIYSKNEKDDLSPDEKKALRQLAEVLRSEAIVSYQRWLKDIQK